jgi:hypothetical protein
MNDALARLVLNLLGRSKLFDSHRIMRARRKEGVKSKYPPEKPGALVLLAPQRGTIVSTMIQCIN